MAAHAPCDVGVARAAQLVGGGERAHAGLAGDEHARRRLGHRRLYFGQEVGVGLGVRRAVPPAAGAEVRPLLQQAKEAAVVVNLEQRHAHAALDRGARRLLRATHVQQHPARRLQRAPLLGLNLAHAASNRLRARAHALSASAPPQRATTAHAAAMAAMRRARGAEHAARRQLSGNSDRYGHAVGGWALSARGVARPAVRRGKIVRVRACCALTLTAPMRRAPAEATRREAEVNATRSGAAVARRGAADACAAATAGT